jgi:ParB family chromosome partitioning protein
VLGRGLEALIPAAAPGIYEVALDDIRPGAQQPRKRFDEAGLEELAQSMRSVGILQPLIVSAADESGKHRLITGERRWQAARLAGFELVPVVEREGAGASALEIALVENLQRQDLDPLEEASAFDQLIKDFGLTQEEVAIRVGRSRAGIANSIRLLSLPRIVRDALAADAITEGHARALLGIQAPAIIEKLLQRVIDQELTVRQTERLAKAAKQTPTTEKQSSKESPREAEFRALEDRLRASLGTKVSVTRGRKSGRIVIEYYSDDDLQSLVDRLLTEA